MHRSLGCLAFAAGMLVPACHAQLVPDPLNPISSAPDGLHIYEVSIFSGYSTSAFPFGGGGIPTGNDAALNSDVNYGASASVGWQHHRERTSFSVRYSASYSGLVHYSAADGFSEGLTLGVSRQMSPKWTFSLSASGQDATLIQVLNEPTSLSVTSQLSSDFGDFAAAFGLGSYSTSEAASAILGAPVVQAPIRSLLLGNKVLSYSGTTGVTYAYSRHLNFHVSAFGSGGESRAAPFNGVPGTNFVLPAGFGADAGMSLLYSLSPRTDLAFNVDVDRLQNRFQTGYTSTADVSVGRKMGMHWFARVYAGATYTEITQQSSGTALPLQAIGGASLGVKTHENTFVASYNRSASDSYGEFIGTYSTLSGTWSWRRPGSRLGVFANYGEQQITNTGFESFSGWQAAAGFNERLTDNTGMSAQYIYSKTAGTYLGATSDFSVQSVRLTMSWYPQVMQR
jgi:hypothetical protein